MVSSCLSRLMPLLSLTAASFTFVANVGIGVADAEQALRAQTVADALSGVLIFERQDGLQIHMTTCTVTPALLPSGGAEVLLYQEQANFKNLDKPYRQRFMKVRNVNETQVISESFRPKNNEHWVQFCRQPEGDRIISQVELEPSHCTVLLQRQRNGIVGETQPRGCPSRFKGATSVHNRIILTSEGMQTFDKGLDDKGNIVWGSRGKPYTFIKASPSTSTLQTHHP